MKDNNQFFDNSVDSFVLVVSNVEMSKMSLTYLFRSSISRLLFVHFLSFQTIQFSNKKCEILVMGF